MKIRPLHDWVLLEGGEAEERTPGGIIIPDVAKEKPQSGVVVAAGPGAYKEEKGQEKGKKKKEKKFVPTEVKPGDKVLYQKYLAREVEIDGEQVIMVREDSILGIFDTGKSGSTSLQKKATGELQKKAAGQLQKKGTTAVAKTKKAPAKGKSKK